MAWSSVIPRRCTDPPPTPRVRSARAQVLVEDWRIEYNTVRPRSALGYLTPTDYAKAWTTHHPERS
jgi:transposase InsO family protein